MIKETMVNENVHSNVPYYKNLSWTAIFIGALVGVGLGLLLKIFGLAIGLSALSMNAHGGTVIAIGGFLGFAIGIIVSMFMAGFTTGYLGRCTSFHCNLGIIYGFTTWTVVMLLSAVMMGYMGQFVSTYSANLNHSMVMAPHSDKAKVDAVIVEMPANPSNDLNVAKATTVDDVSDLALSTILMFILFFLGALSSCLGAWYGISCKRCD